MHEKNSKEVKMIGCFSNRLNFLKAEILLRKINAAYVIKEVHPDNLKFKSEAERPDLIITDEYLWEMFDGISIVEELNKEKHIPILIWSGKMSSVIANAIFLLSNVYFVKDTGEDEAFMNALVKLKSLYLIN